MWLISCILYVSLFWQILCQLDVDKFDELRQDLSDVVGEVKQWLETQVVCTLKGGVITAAAASQRVLLTLKALVPI